MLFISLLIVKINFLYYFYIMILIDKVRTATYDLHQSLDHSLVPYLETIKSKEQYADLLQLFYGFFRPVYDKIDVNLELQYLPDYLNRRKPEWILNDLQDLEVNYTIQLCEHLPEIKNNAAAFGALYVLEGSTLGGVVIRKMLYDQLHIDKGLTFFSGYGKQTREYWNVFINSLNNLDNHSNAEEIVIQTAAATFKSFKEWLQYSGQAERTLKHRNTPAAY